MNGANIWLRWVREGSAYTITKSRREKTKIERIRAAAFLIGYAAGYVERIEGRDCPYMSEDPYCRYIELGYDEILNKSYHADWGMLEEFCEDLLKEYNPLDEYPTLKRFLFYACDMIVELSSYVSTNHNDDMKVLCKKRIKRIAESLHSPKAGAIARRAFVEIEKALRDMTEPEIEEDE
jgi:hypothetical protein